MLNQVYICSNSKTKYEPKKVVIRKYGGNTIENIQSLRPLTTTEELVLLCELGRRNLAPKLYGFFDGGRIEEYIDSHEVTAEEACTPEIEVDFAKNLARFHAVNDVPFPKPGYDFGVVLREQYRVAKEGIDKILANKELAPLYHIVKYDWEKEFRWLSQLIHLTKHRIVLMHWDAHLGNIGIRNNKPENNEGLSTILYDYELASYNMRGKDIGVFLMAKTDFLFGKLKTTQ